MPATKKTMLKFGKSQRWKLRSRSSKNRGMFKQESLSERLRHGVLFIKK